MMSGDLQGSSEGEFKDKAKRALLLQIMIGNPGAHLGVFPSETVQEGPI